MKPQGWMRPRVHVRRCVACRERLNENGMRLYGVGTVCPLCWGSIRAERRAARDTFHEHTAWADLPSEVSSREAA